MLFPKFINAYIIAIIFPIGKIYPTLVIVINKQAIVNISSQALSI